MVFIIDLKEGSRHAHASTGNAESSREPIKKSRDHRRHIPPYHRIVRTGHPDIGHIGGAIRQ